MKHIPSWQPLVVGLPFYYLGIYFNNIYVGLFSVVCLLLSIFYSRGEKYEKVFKTKRLNLKKFLGKKGYSTGFSWIYGLVTLFGLGLLYIVFSQVFVGHLIPTIKGMSATLPVGDQASVDGGIDNYMIYFRILPIVLFFVVVIYMIVASVRKESEDTFA